MKTLFIDTSNKDVSIATLKDHKMLSLKQDNIFNKHSVYTIPYIKEVLEKSNIKSNEIDKILVINGPGSFTGIRIGLTIVKIYSYLLNINVVCISSLKALSLSTKGNTISLIDAKNDNYYVGIYDDNNNSVIEEQFINYNELKHLLEKYKDYQKVSYEEFDIDNYHINKINLDIEKIDNYYQENNGINNFEVTTNYLKLPQALEELNDNRK